MFEKIVRRNFLSIELCGTRKWQVVAFGMISGDRGGDGAAMMVVGCCAVVVALVGAVNSVRCI